jgi:hypothetical protein
MFQRGLLIWFKVLLLIMVNAGLMVVMVTTTTAKPSLPGDRPSTQSKFLDFIGQWLFGGQPQPAAPSDRRKGGPPRDECPATALALTALVPSSNPDLAREHTTTIAERPAFWFYVPYSPELQQSVEFALVDENEQDFYKATFRLTNTPGIVSIRIPENHPPLVPDQLYHWVFSVACSPGNRSGDVAVDGWVKRAVIDSDLSKRLQQAATTQQKLALYTDKRFWHETLNTLIEWRRSNPQDQEANGAWLNLLKSAGLSTDIANQPLTSCCSTIANRPEP